MGDLNFTVPTSSVPKRPPSYSYQTIADLYADFEAKLEGTCVVDPQGYKVHFLAENFPHLVKLEFLNPKTNTWGDAVANRTMPQLKSRTQDDARYRIGDLSRPRTLFWLPEVISKPDSIHENKRGNGNDVYLKRFSRTGKMGSIKMALVTARPNGQRVIVTSFWADDKYVLACVKMPPRYP